MVSKLMRQKYIDKIHQGRGCSRTVGAGMGLWFPVESGHGGPKWERRAIAEIGEKHSTGHVALIFQISATSPVVTSLWLQLGRFSDIKDSGVDGSRLDNSGQSSRLKVLNSHLRSPITDPQGAGVKVWTSLERYSAFRTFSVPSIFKWLSSFLLAFL